MTVKAIAEGQYYSTITGNFYPTPEDAHAAEQSMTQPVQQPSSADRAAAVANAPTGQTAYIAPDGTIGYRAQTDAERSAALIDQSKATAAAAPVNPNGNPLDTVNQVLASQQPYVRQPIARGQFQSQMPVSGGVRVAGQAPAAGAGVDMTGFDPSALAAIASPAPGTPGGGAPIADTAAVDTSIAGVNNTIAQLLALANAPQYSVAEQQLLDSDRRNALAQQQALSQNQAAALGAARSGNRRDQAILQRQAVGESAYLGQEEQRQRQAQQTALEGNLATARAAEQSQYLQDRANMLSKAADLGLNVAALQADVSKANLASASNYMNNLFQQQGIDKQLSEDQAKNALSFVQAMAAIQTQYDAMSNADQQHTLDLMMQQYSVDKQTAAAIEQARISKQMNWGQVLAGALGGATQGGVLAAGKLAGI